MIPGVIYDYMVQDFKDGDGDGEGEVRGGEGGWGGEEDSIFSRLTYARHEYLWQKKRWMEDFRKEGAWPWVVEADTHA